MAKTPVSVFVAEDDEDARELLSLVLRDRGFAVTECRDGRELVRAFADASPEPNVIVADLEMPELDGVDAVRRILESATPRIFFMTALRDAPLLEQARELGERVFHKPLDVQELVSTIEASVA